VDAFPLAFYLRSANLYSEGSELDVFLKPTSGGYCAGHNSKSGRIVYLCESEATATNVFYSEVKQQLLYVGID